jgi:hypothetical protein
MSMIRKDVAAINQVIESSKLGLGLASLFVVWDPLNQRASLTLRQWVKIVNQMGHDSSNWVGQNPKIGQLKMPGFQIDTAQ